MTNPELKHFELLKQQIEATFQSHYPTCQESISEWKGQLIALFQEDLSKEVGGYVSEKWFYTHLKTAENEKLPRIDLLNLLAAYVGVENWDAFVYEANKNDHIPLEQETEQAPEELKMAVKKTALNLWGIIFGLFFIVIIMVLVSFFNKEEVYQFCVVDTDSGLPIVSKEVQVYWLRPKESPMPLKVDSMSCIQLPSHQKEPIQLRIQALYYHPTTITRTITDTENTETIALKKDDYALMIHYFSTNNMDDWNKRREQLAMMLSPNARIVQVHSETGGGMALYNKEEFINKMTLPIKSLKNIKILETKYDGEQIVEIRFMLQPF